ncbi:AI-2E family transporter [Agrobacterium sp. ES01]|uniref:AI-2E family transporter n=1 Tax=Agrobacterium sp. ES01 TaxID=3420714 RepID=UPI003D09D678
MKRAGSIPKRIDFSELISVMARLSVILVALLAIIAAMDYGEIIIAPVSLGVVVGLMVAPLARILERRGLSSWLSSGVVVLLLLFIIMSAIIGFSVPISGWVQKAPEIWKSLQLQISDWRSTLSSLNDIRDRLGQAAGEVGHMKVTVDEGGGVGSVITLAPVYVAQVLLFLASLYFFVATRDDFRAAVLKLCITRNLRWRMAHIFRDVETMMSRYLFTITIINIGLGLSVGFALWMIGTPSALVWGLLAAVLNYVVYVGPVLMAIILMAIGLATYDSGFAIMLPAMIYLSLNLMESQFVTPRALGSSMTINPFLIFLALTFWLWLWGPIGGFIAVPSLLVFSAILKNILPTVSVGMANRAGNQFEAKTV